MDHVSHTRWALLVALLVSGTAFAQAGEDSVFPATSVEPSAPASDAALHEHHQGPMGEQDSLVGNQEGVAGSHDDMNMEGGHRHRVDTVAPAFLWGDHVHMPGEWMVSYRYSNVYMHGNQSGTTSLTDQQALDFIGTVPPGMPGMDAFMYAPTGMTMEMHMLHIMRGITDNVTAYVMPMWMDNTMEQVNRDGNVFRSTTSGFSDTEFGALWRIHRGDNDDLILNVGFSAPTANINTSMTMDMGMGMPMTMKDGYTMRLGHGTWDARPGITYKYYWERMSLGLQGLIDVPLGMNDEQYQVGHEYRANAWVALLLDRQKKLAATFRVEGLWRGNVVGADPALNPAMISTADPNMQGGDYLNFGYGLMYQLPGHLGKLIGEYVHPVYQNLRGEQLSTVGALAVRYDCSF